MCSTDRRAQRNHRRFFPALIQTAAFMYFFVVVFSGHASANHTQLALSFDGSNDFAHVTFDPGVNFTQMTIQVWVRPERFDPPRETFAGFLRAVSQLPPRHGFIKTQDSKLLIYQDKTDWTRWGFYVSTANADGSPAGETEIPATTVFDRTRPEQWYHLAVTFNGSAGSGGAVILYQDGLEAGRATLPGDRITNILSLWFGRWVAATAADMGTVAIHSRVLDQVEIQENMSCGVSAEGLFAYWPFNEDSGQIIGDVSGSGHDGYLGDSRDGDGSEPQRVSADYQVASGDSDGDGIPDGCDNCPTVASDNLEDRDGDGYGTVCDLCPQTPNDDADGDGYADPCDVIAQTDTVLVGTSVVSTTEWLGSDAHWVPPGADTVQLICCEGPCLDSANQVIWENVVRTNCVYTVPRVVAIVEEVAGSGYGLPGGDAESVTAGQTGDVTFDLFEWFAPQDLARITECTTRYLSYREFRAVDYETGECFADVCPDPNEPSYEIFIGASNVDTTPLRFRGVELDVKPCSTPSCFGMSGSGVVPVAIHSTADFDAGTVDPSTVKLGIDPDTAYCTPRDWSIGQLPCAPGNHLILHFDKSCLSSIGVGTETKTLSIAAALYDGTSIIGNDPVCIQNE